jgi:PncC family amidohydrolase
MGSETVESAAHVVQKVIARLRQGRFTLGVAESCTGGLLSSWITELPGVSDVFQGAVVAYANRIKVEFLNVPEETLVSSGAVSVQTATAMARGARERLGVDWAISITGVAGPSGGSPQKPVGTVCICISGPEFEGRGEPSTEWAGMQHFAGDRRRIQETSALFALKKLLELLER